MTDPANLTESQPVIPVQPNTYHPELLDHASSIVDYLSQETKRHEELVAQVRLLHGQLSNLYSSLTLTEKNVENTVNQEVQVVKNDVQAVINTFPTTITKVENKIKSVAGVSIWKKITGWF